jgi:hypothetical protein
MKSGDSVNESENDDAEGGLFKLNDIKPPTSFPKSSAIQEPPDVRAALPALFTSKFACVTEPCVEWIAVG